MIKVVFYAILVFFIVGVDWNYMQLCAFSLVALASFSYGKSLIIFKHNIYTIYLINTLNIIVLYIYFYSNLDKKFVGFSV